ESSITIREGITMNCKRWGCHARHNGEVSARSVIALDCATEATGEEHGAAVADRVADMDVREAYLSGRVCIRASNASTICARGCHIVGGTAVSPRPLVLAEYSGRINASQVEFANTSGTGINVNNGGIIDAFNLVGSPTIGSTLNTLTQNGVIFG
ncbi:MAG: hypothetical protein IIZ94_14660, partial [Prevotella sp.]|nr:hypothetical protein [Prevotella sp.]